MADTGAPWNLPYVEPSDLVRDYPAADEAQALAVAAGLSAAGGLVAVKSAIFTGVQTNSTGSGANFAVTDLTLTHEVADAANSVVLYAIVNGSSDTSTTRVSFAGAIAAGGSLLTLGGAAADRRRVATATTGSSSFPNLSIHSVPLLAVHAPGVTTSVTYDVRVINATANTQTLYVNRGTGDGADANNVRAASILVLMEVKV